MPRLLVLFLASAVFASAADTGSIVGKVQPEIRLTDGTVFKKAKIVDYSIDKATATIAEPTRIRVVPLDTLPPKLRDQLFTEAGVKPPASGTRHAPAHPRPSTPTQSPINTAGPITPVATTTPVPRDQLLKQAATTTPDQLKAYLTRTYGRVGSLSTKVLDTGEVPGWPRIRVSGETSFTEWAPGQRASSLRQEKFEIEYTVLDGGGLRPETVTVGGIVHPFAEK